MARTFKVDLHAANIVTHPHSLAGYESLARRMFDAKQPIQIRGDRFALLTSLRWRKRKSDDARVVAVGTLSTFTQIDMQAPWLNVQTGAAAEDGETETIAIPKELRPNLAQFSFWFDLKRHLLIVQGTSRMLTKNKQYKKYFLGPQQIERYLGRLTSMEEVKRNFDRIDITVVPDSKTIRQILDSNGLRSITLTIKPPNSDTLASRRGAVMQRLNQMGAKAQVETYTALPSKNLDPDDDLRAMAKIASTNGRVDAKVATDSGIIPVSTVGKPLTESYEIDTDIETEAHAFEREAPQLVSQIASQNGD